MILYISLNSIIPIFAYGKWPMLNDQRGVMHTHILFFKIYISCSKAISIKIYPHVLEHKIIISKIKKYLPEGIRGIHKMPVFMAVTR